MKIVYEKTGRVVGIYYGVNDTIKGDYKDSKSAIPNPEAIPNMEPVLMFNPESDKLYYDYIAVESLETRLSRLTEENNANQLALMELHMIMLKALPNAE